MKKSIPIVAAFLLAFASSSFGAPMTITFGDTAKFWPGWDKDKPADNNSDTIGTPDLVGGSLDVDNGQLNSLTIDYINKAYYPAFPLTAGDLFIDVGSNLYWDYVVTRGRDIYSFSDFAINNSMGYIFSSKPTTGSWNIRDKHPIAYETASGLGTLLGDKATVTTPFNYSETGKGLTFTFSGLNLDVGNDFTIAWTVSCANDVLYEQIKVPSVPEPATLLLLGTGLLGLVGFRRKGQTS